MTQSIQSYNLSVNTSELLNKTKIGHVSFTRPATKQQFSNVFANTIDKRLPAFNLYNYQHEVVTTKDSNILIVSGTGSGKTEATYFHVLPKLKKGIRNQVLAIYPTNILAKQQNIRVKDYAKSFALTSRYLSGETINKQHKSLVYELITTNPSFIIDQYLNKKRYQQFNEDYRNLQFVIFDEIHMYNARQIAIIKEWLSLVSPPYIIFLSATIGNLDELAKYMTSVNGKKTKIFHGLASKAETRYIILPNKSILDKIEIFSNFLEEKGITLVFTNSIRESDDLRSELINYLSTTRKFRNIPVENAKTILSKLIIRHHSALSQEDRIYAENRLKYGGIICFSPKTLAQGIDIATVTRIVHIGLPSTLAEFLQREGRAGRRSETKLTESLIFTTTRYDDIICRNALFFRKYVEGSPEKILILKNSPVSHLYRLLHTVIVGKTLQLADNDLFFLRSLELLDENLSMTKKGKAFVKRYFSFYGQTYHIKFLTPQGKKKDRISIDDLKLKYQPGSIHFKNRVLQKVVEYDPESKVLTPVFEKVSPKTKIAKLYFNNHLRSIVVIKEKTPKLEYSRQLTEIQLIPVQVSLNYLDYDQSPPVYKTYKSFKAKMIGINRLTIFFKVENYVFPFNMEMAVHCFIEALRITQDIRYTEINHSVQTKGETTVLLIYESELSGLLLNIDVEFSYRNAHAVYAQYLRDHYDAINEINVLPIPSCRYSKKEDEVHVIPQVERALKDIKAQLSNLQRNFGEHNTHTNGGTTN